MRVQGEVDICMNACGCGVRGMDLQQNKLCVEDWKLAFWFFKTIKLTIHLMTGNWNGTVSVFDCWYLNPSVYGGGSRQIMRYLLCGVSMQSTALLTILLHTMTRAVQQLAVATTLLTGVAVFVSCCWLFILNLTINKVAQFQGWASEVFTPRARCGVSPEWRVLLLV